jgi:hypothetical protein
MGSKTIASFTNSVYRGRSRSRGHLAVVSIGELDLKIGLDQEVREVLTSPDGLRGKLSEVLDIQGRPDQPMTQESQGGEEGIYQGPDGVVVALGSSWSGEAMLQEANKRAS